MSGLLTRRRAMMQSAGAPPQPVETWDYEWDYSQGLLSANGWEKTVSGSASETLAANGVKLSSAGSSYCRVEKTDYKAAQVVMLVECDIPAIAATATSVNLRISVSNGTNGIQICENNGRWQLYDADYAADRTPIKTFATGTHTVRLQLDNGVGAVWIDGELCASNVASSSILYSGRTLIMSQNQSGYSVIKSVKLKKNRL